MAVGDRRTVVHHDPVWEPAELRIDAAGNTRPGFVCVHELENGNGQCQANLFRVEDEIGDHSCVVAEGGRDALSSTRFAPDETRHWSTRELATLIGKTVSTSFRPDGLEPHTGVVVDAGIGRFGQAWVEFEGGGSAAWSRDEVSVTIIVEA